jgi:hypothetical protein
MVAQDVCTALNRGKSRHGEHRSRFVRKTFISLMIHRNRGGGQKANRFGPRLALLKDATRFTTEGEAVVNRGGIVFNAKKAQLIIPTILRARDFARFEGLSWSANH